MFAVHPGEVHANETRFEEGCSYCTFNIDSRLIEQLDPLGRGLSFWLHPLIEDRAMFRSFLGCFDAVKQGASQLAIDSVLLDSLNALIVRHSRQRLALPELADSPSAVRIARDYLLDNPSQNVSLRTLGELVGLSPFHLARTFKDRVGVPPHRFQTSVRLEHAKRLLRQGWRVARVAAECGFADQSHLIRAFKQIVGVTPIEYRGPQDYPSQRELSHEYSNSCARNSSSARVSSASSA